MVVMILEHVLIDIAISGDTNVTKTRAKTILEHKDLAVEIQRMWNVKTNVMPVTIGRNENVMPVTIGRNELCKSTNIELVWTHK